MGHDSTCHGPLQLRTCGYTHDVTLQEKHSCVAAQYSHIRTSGYAHGVDNMKKQTGGYIHGASQECVMACYSTI